LVPGRKENTQVKHGIPVNPLSTPELPVAISVLFESSVMGASSFFSFLNIPIILFGAKTG
jgi:hypothetical protein